MRVTLISCFAVVVWMSSACGADFQAGDGGGGTTSGTGGTGTGGTASGSNCVEPLQFVPAIPPDWEGPLVLATGDTPGAVPDCPEETTIEDEVKRGVLAPDLACQCACGPLKPAECSAAFGMYSNGECGTKVYGATLQHNSCSDFSSGGNILSFDWFATEAPPSVCDATPGNTQTPVGWDQHARVCLTDWEGCMEAPPSSFEPTQCIRKAGDQDCPEGAYTEHNLFFHGAEDHRACEGDCSCDPSGVTCGGHLSAYIQGSCQASIEPPGLNEGCFPSTNSPPHSGRYAAAPTGQCEPEGTATPTGKATPTGPVTVCCLPVSVSP